MSNKQISRYLTKEDGTTFSSDTELLGLSVNSKVKNKNSGYTFKKTGSNVFDKTPIEVETNAVLYTSQTLTDAQKTQARNNIGASSSSAVLYTSQTLTNDQKEQARTNIGAGKAESVLYTAQTLTDAQKLQARTNIGVSDLSGVPLGTIVIWSGNASSIPSGWHICDGNAGTPDLTQKFVLGAGGVYPLNSTGGAVDHFHFFGFHAGDNNGSFYVCGELHGDETNTAKGVNVKSPTKQALISALNFGTSSAVIIDEEIGSKTAMWNGDNGGGIADHDKFTKGNMITSRGYAAGTTSAEADCMPPYYVLYYIMKITGNDSTASGGTAASATQVEALSNLISQLQTRIASLESSGTSSSSGSGGGTFTLGNEFTATIVSIGEPTGPIPVGTIITPNLFHQSDGAYYGGSSQVLGSWTIYQGTSTSSSNRLESGSYVVTQQSTVTGNTVETSPPYTQRIHTLKLRKITGVNV